MKSGGEEKKAAGATGVNTEAESALMEALVWARSEAEVFAGIDMAVHPDFKTWTSVLERMLKNAGHVDMAADKLNAIAKAMHTQHANPFTLKVDLEKVRAMVRRQHQQVLHASVGLCVGLFLSYGKPLF